MLLRHLDSTRAVALAVIVASVAVYVPTLGHGFVRDDSMVVVNNRFVRSLDQIPTLVRSTELAGMGIALRAYRPLTGVTFALNHAAAGLSPWSYHATNVLLHALAAALLLGVGLRLGIGLGAAGAGALLFAIHPIHVEAVANVAGRKDVLPAVCALAAVLLHRRALLRGGLDLAWPVLAIAGAMLAKESGVVAIGLVALSDLAWIRPDGASIPNRRRAGLYAAYAVALAGYLFLYLAVTAGVGTPPTLNDNVTAHTNTAVRVMTAVAVIGKGLALQIAPWGQSPDWSYHAIPLVTSPADTRFLAAVATLVAWLGLGIALRRRMPIVVVGLAWYLGTALPASNVFFPSLAAFGERLLYLPSAGLALVIGAGLATVADRIPRVPLGLASLGMGAALCVATLSYSHTWGDDLRLGELAAARVPDSSRAQVMLSSALLGRGETSASLAAAERAVALNPWNASAHWARAQVLQRLGRFEEERQAVRASLARSRGDADVQFRAPDEERARALRAALETNPSDADALHGLGSLARDAGRLEDAVALWRRAIAANPRHAAALSDLGRMHFLRGQEDFALELCLLAVDADPRAAGAWYTLGELYAARSDSARSRAAFARFSEIAGSAHPREADAVKKMPLDESH